MNGFDAAFFFLCFLRSARASGDFVLAGASRHGGGPFANNGLAESHSITPWPRENKNQNGADKARAVGVDDFPVAWDSRNPRQDRAASQTAP